MPSPTPRNIETTIRRVQCFFCGANGRMDVNAKGNIFRMYGWNMRIVDDSFRFVCGTSCEAK